MSTYPQRTSFTVAPETRDLLRPPGFDPPDRRSDWVSMSDEEDPGIDTSVPHSARIWNYWLGGKDNYPVDRAVNGSSGRRSRE